MKGKNQNWCQTYFFQWHKKAGRRATSANLFFQDSGIGNAIPVNFVWTWSQLWLGTTLSTSRFWKTCERQAEWIREGKGSCEREEYFCYRAHYVTITIIPFTWLNSWGNYEGMAGLNSFPLFHLKSTTNSLYLFLIYHRAITEWNYLSAVIIHDDHHFKETLS